MLRSLGRVGLWASLVGATVVALLLVPVMYAIFMLYRSLAKENGTIKLHERADIR